MNQPEEHPAAAPPDEGPERVPVEFPPWVRIGLPAVVFGLLDVWLVRSGGRSLGSALVAGTVLALFIAVVLARIERSRAARRQREAGGPRTGSWSNPSGRQRFLRRLRNLSGRSEPPRR